MSQDGIITIALSKLQAWECIVFLFYCDHGQYRNLFVSPLFQPMLSVNFSYGKLAELAARNRPALESSGALEAREDEVYIKICTRSHARAWNRARDALLNSLGSDPHGLLAQAPQANMPLAEGFCLQLRNSLVCLFQKYGTLYSSDQCSSEEKQIRHELSRRDAHTAADGCQAAPPSQEAGLSSS